MKKDKVDNDAFFKALAADARRHPIDFQDAPQGNSAIARADHAFSRALEADARRQQPSLQIDNDKSDRSMIDSRARYLRVSGFAEQDAYNAAVDEAIQTVGVRADVFGVEPALMESDLRGLRRKLRRIRWQYFIRRVWLLFTV